MDIKKLDCNLYASFSYRSSIRIVLHEMMALERKRSIIHVGCQPTNLSFSGCGFLGAYHIGVASCFRQHAPTFLNEVKIIYGCSAGAIIGAMLLCDVCSGELCRSTLDIVRDVRSRYLGTFNPGFDPCRILRDGFKRVLPPDAHKRCNERLHISLSKCSFSLPKNWDNIIVSEYLTRDELIDALLCSSFVPIFSGFTLPTYRGVYYMDGGITNNLPGGSDTITISPWSGGSDICPLDSCSSIPLDVKFANTSVQMTMRNLRRLIRVLWPPEGEILSDFCRQGFHEASIYLTNHGLFETVNPSPRSMSFCGELTDVDARRMKCRQLSDASKWKAMQSSNSSDFLREMRWTEDETDSNTSDTDCLTMSVDHRSESTSSDETTDSTGGVDGPSENELVSTDDYFPWQDYFEDNPLFKLLPIAAIVTLPSTAEELDEILRSNLPYAVMKALDECQSEGSNNIPPKLSTIASICGIPLSVTRMSLEKSFTFAMYVLNHASYVPGNVKWLLTLMSKLVLELEKVARASCNEIIRRLLNNAGKVSDEAKLLFSKLFISIQILIVILFNRISTIKLPWVSKLARIVLPARVHTAFEYIQNLLWITVA